MDWLTLRLAKFTDDLIHAPRRLNNDEAWALELAKAEECRYALKKACIATGFGSRYYPSRKGTDLFVTNRLNKASTARLRHWAQGKVTKV